MPEKFSEIFFEKVLTNRTGYDIIIKSLVTVTVTYEKFFEKVSGKGLTNYKLCDIMIKSVVPATAS